jgi:hypothetical protein
MCKVLSQNVRKRHRKLHRVFTTCGGALILSSLGWIHHAKALDIVLQEAPPNTTLEPVYDPNLTQLGNIMQAAANYWEGIIKDNHTITVTYGYADLGPGTHGIAEVTGTSGVRAASGNVAFDIENNTVGDWYFDSTPTVHSEFAMHQVLRRDLGIVADNLYFNESPPDLLEVGYWGHYVGADAGRDALTTAIHELGHILGMHDALPLFLVQTMDGDYDFSSTFIQGNDASVNYHSPAAAERVHLRSSDSVMAVGSGNGDRNLPSATDLFAIASVGVWSDIDLPRKDFWGNGATNWNQSMNWPGNRLPDAGDVVHVRNNATANLTSANGAAGDLFIQEDSQVNTGSNTLNVTNKITLEGAEPGGSGNLTVNTNGRVVAHEIELNQGGSLTLTTGVTEEVDADIVDINPGGVVIGNGSMRVNTALYNDGVISAFAGAPGNELAILSGPVDLDGLSEQGQVFATAGNIRISASTLDAFDGELTVGANRQFEKFGGWQIGEGPASDAEIRLEGGHGAAPAVFATSGGSTTFAGGTVHASGSAIIRGSKQFTAGSQVEIAANGTLRLEDATTFVGGSYQGAGKLVLADSIQVHANTNLDVTTVDLDGSNGTTALSLQNAVLAVNASAVDSGSNTFNGSLTFSGNNAGLNIQLANASEHWTMAGNIQTTGGNGGLYQPMIQGSPVRVLGAIEADGLSQISAPLDLVGSIATADASTIVRLAGAGHIIRNTASVSGAGELRMGANAVVGMEDTTALDIDVLSGGRFEAGIALATGTNTIMGNYEQTSIGTLGMELDGAPLVGQDRLIVGGSADIDGTLEVTAIHGFVPTVGNIYTLLSAASVSGTFDTVELLSDSIFKFTATTLYSANQIRLRIDDTSMFGDFNDDLALNCRDVNLLVAEIAMGGMSDAFDLNGDNMVSVDDLSTWLSEAGTFNVGGPYLPGDANLDGVVDGTDFGVWNANKFTLANGWCGGDFNADGATDGSDFGIWNANKFQSSTAAAAVPEPTTLGWMAGLLGLLIGRRAQR